MAVVAESLPTASERPGQTAALIGRCQGYHAYARRVWGGRFLGRSPRAKRASAGTEAFGETDYATGDDFRYVDWNRAARLDELVSRRFHAQDTGRVVLLIDTAGSMLLGTPSKLTLARQLAGVLGYLALAETGIVHAVGAGLPATEEYNATGSLAGPSRVTNLGPSFVRSSQANAWLQAVELAGSADLLLAAEQVAAACNSDDTVVVLSDFLAPHGFKATLDAWSRSGCDIFAIQILATEDVDPRWTGGVQLHDFIGGALGAELDEDDLEAYRQVVAEYCRNLQHHCRRSGMRLAQFRSDIGLDATVQRLIDLAAIPRTANT